VSLAVNLGATTTDQSCLAAHPSTTGANMAYLRSRNGSCATSYDRDPSARVTFGVYAPETRKVIEIHDMQ
jgi:MSHA biogenesis protein MshQ